jgi:hypothetical protein
LKSKPIGLSYQGKKKQYSAIVVTSLSSAVA